MSVSRRVRLLAFAHVLLAAVAPTRGGDFSNGGFESGTLTGWTEEYAEYKGWKQQGSICDEKGEPDFKSDALGRKWKASQDWPRNAQVLSQFTLLDGTVITPDEGAFMAKIGDLDGDEHAARLQQSIFLFGNDRKWSNVHLNWAAMLVDGNHDCKQQPIFLVDVEIRRPSKGVVKSLQFELLQQIRITASDVTKPGSGWTFSGFHPTGATYFKRGAFDIPLTDSYPSGSELRVTIIVAGCSEGGHGSIAFLDNVRLDNVCDLDCLSGMHQKIADQAPVWIPNAFTPNGDGINDVWEIKGVTFVRQVTCQITNRWNNVVHTYTIEAPPFQTFNYATIPIWDGRMNGKPVQQDTYVYKLWLKNCLETKEFVGKVTVVR